MRRREFVTLLGGATAAWPLVARAQQDTPPAIGFLGTASPALWASRLRAFHQGLSESGYVDGKNVAIEYRWAEGRYEQLPVLAADLAAHRVDVIVTPGSAPATFAAKAATTTIPIVFGMAIDPVKAGFVHSLNRPGGNLTGVVSLNAEVLPKRLELLHQLLPNARNVALLVNQGNVVLSAQAKSSELLAAAQKLGLDVHVLNASAERDFDRVFDDLARLRAEGLVIGSDAFFSSQAERLGALTLRHGVAAIFSWREFAAAGGLVSYGASYTDEFRLVGGYAGRILRGEKPQELPVQQSTKVELIINLKTAKTLGLTVPLPVLGRADDVIE